MKKHFGAFYRLTEDDRRELWKSGHFVLDANVLLNLYRYPKKASDDLLEAFKALKERLWVPYHAALEYQRNRLAVIAEQKGRFADVRNIVSEVVPDVKKQLDALQLDKRHSSIQPDGFVKSLQQAVDK